MTLVIKHWLWFHAGGGTLFTLTDATITSGRLVIARSHRNQPNSRLILVHFSSCSKQQNNLSGCAIARHIRSRKKIWKIRQRLSLRWSKLLNTFKFCAAFAESQWLPTWRIRALPAWRVHRISQGVSVLNPPFTSAEAASDGTKRLVNGLLANWKVVNSCPCVFPTSADSNQQRATINVFG